MLLRMPSDIQDLALYLERFLGLVGHERWFKRCDQLEADQHRSPFLWKIVSDYHWLEMAIRFQTHILAKEGRLLPEHANGHILAALNFAATASEVHARLSPRGQQVLEGRLRDSLKAETGFAALYLEVDLAQRLMDGGYDVEFVDMEGSARFDLHFSRETFAGEVECKSLSADAGRQIHRKDFYRFMEAITPALAGHAELKRQEVLVITLDARLSSNTSQQRPLVKAVTSLLRGNALRHGQGAGFRLERRSYAECLGQAALDGQQGLYKACVAAFGENSHVAGGLTEDGGCLVIMRSNREDDPSKAKLEAMRKAASQFTGARPAFIAIQEHGLKPADLMLPHVRRKAGILSYALFGHYGADHVNATYITGFEPVVTRNGRAGTPAFAVPNPKPKFTIGPTEAAPFLEYISDANFAEAIGAPLLAPGTALFSIDPARQR